MVKFIVYLRMSLSNFRILNDFMEKLWEIIIYIINGKNAFGSKLKLMAV